MIVTALMVFGIFTFALGAGVPDPSPGYRIFQTISLTIETDGMNGTLQLLQDERITDELRDNMHGSDDGMYCYEDALGAFCESIRTTPLKPTLVRLVDGVGRVVDSRTFKRELGSMEVRKLYGRRPRAFSVTVDFGIGWGSYAGDITYFFDLKGGRLRWLTARGRTGGVQIEVTAMTSLKTSWQLVRSGGGGGQDILEIACRPKFSPGRADEDVAFELIFRRFHFHGGGWIISERRTPGFWEDDKEFPGPGEFPQ